jgi:hypothetical protein
MDVMQAPACSPFDHLNAKDNAKSERWKIKDWLRSVVKSGHESQKTPSLCYRSTTSFFGNDDMHVRSDCVCWKTGTINIDIEKQCSKTAESG